MASFSLSYLRHSAWTSPKTRDAASSSRAFDVAADAMHRSMAARLSSAAFVRSWALAMLSW